MADILHTGDKVHYTGPNTDTSGDMQGRVGLVAGCAYPDPTLTDADFTTKHHMMPGELADNGVDPYVYFQVTPSVRTFFIVDRANLTLLAPWTPPVTP